MKEGEFADIGMNRPVVLKKGALQPGDRVRINPKRRADVFDMVLTGKIAVVTSIEQDLEDKIHVSVMVEDDPGKDMGAAWLPAHRFFFGIDELDRVGPDEV